MGVSGGNSSESDSPRLRDLDEDVEDEWDDSLGMRGNQPPAPDVVRSRVDIISECAVGTRKVIRKIEYQSNKRNETSRCTPTTSVYFSP